MVKIYVEGGGDSASLKTECREAFSKLIQNAGFEGRMPRIVACGGRTQALADFRAAASRKKEGDVIVLLIDSEKVVDPKYEIGNENTWIPWSFLKDTENWDVPDGCDDSQCHLMTTCMETWIVADIDNITAYFGEDFNCNPLPKEGNDIEKIDHNILLKDFEAATRNCSSKGKYAKGRDSFKLLKASDSKKIRKKCKWGKRFFDYLEDVL